MNTSTKYLLLNQMSILDSLTESEKQRLAELSVYKNLTKDDFIYRTNQKISHVFLVEKGAVFVGRKTSFNKPIIKDIIYDNSIFGENVFTKQEFRTDYAQVLKPSKVFCIPLAYFEHLFKSNRQFAFEMTSLMIERLKHIESRIQNFVFLKAKERIGSFLKETAGKKGIKIGIDEILINLGLSHKELAYITDTSRQTVARVLGEFKKSNIIHFSDRKPGKILIRDLNALSFG